MRLSRRAYLQSLLVAIATCVIAASAAVGAAAQSGGYSPGGPGSTGVTISPGQAALMPDGSAVAPPDAPRNVRKAINAANRIRSKPYRWGGGHRGWKSKGYDCSGAVSYVLHAAGLLKRPLDSGGLARAWGSTGSGQWITVYANRRHAYAVIAGLRWDTSSAGDSVSSGRGPRWRATHRAPGQYKARFYPSL